MESEVFMENSQLGSNQPISVLTVADLEALIVKIVQKVLKKETSKLENENLQEIETSQTNQHSYQNFLNTFGTWRDSSTAEEIISDIYNNRTHSNSEYNQ